MSTFITYEGDNLAIMRGLPSESIDLIYIDPPYFSQRNYGDFDDRWKSMQHYLDFMVERLKEMHRLLKQTGSIYVHLDWHAVHYVKVEMDKIFGAQNFQNEIIWYFPNSGMKAKSKRLHQVHNSILRYSKSKNFKSNPIYKNRKDGQNKQALRKFNSDTKKADIVRDDYGKIIYKFSDMILENSVIEVPRLKKSNYQTQKPSKLMERIILASSNEGDLVADFFCGSGSFIKKAHELGRSCIGVDVSQKALYLARSPTEREPDGGKSAKK